MEPKATESLCRICFEPESESHPLIMPCKCTGSMKHIHEDCLKIWLLSQDKDLTTSECDICKSKFQMKITLSTKCTCKNVEAECVSIFIFPFLLTIMISIFSVILIFFIQGVHNGTATTGDEIYLILLIIACLIIIIIVFVIFVRSIKRGCFSSEMVSWKIESIEHTEIVEESLEQNVNTQCLNEVNVMIWPKFLRLNGRNVERPKLWTPRLVPIKRGEEVIGYRSKPVTLRSLNSSVAFKFEESLHEIEEPVRVSDLNFSFDQKIRPE